MLNTRQTRSEAGLPNVYPPSCTADVQLPAAAALASYSPRPVPRHRAVSPSDTPRSPSNYLAVVMIIRVSQQDARKVLSLGTAALCPNSEAPHSFQGVDMPVAKWHPGDMEHVLEEPRKRITARVSEQVRATLEQAAELLGATVNQFVVQSAYVEAQRVLERESIIRLSQQDARKVLSLLDDPPKPNKRLRNAVIGTRGKGRKTLICAHLR